MNHRALAWLMTLLTLCTFTAAAVAGDVLPEESWLQDNLRTTLVTAEGETVPETEFTPAEDGAAVLTCKPAADAPEGEWRVTVHLIGTEDGWTLDTAAPLTLTEAAAEPEDDAGAQPEEDVEAPEAEDVAALLSLAGLCAHGETALEDVEPVVTAYTAEDGTVRAEVTVTPDQAAASAEKALGERHAAGSIAELACEYTLAAVEDGFVLTGMKVVFPLVCGDGLAAQEGDAEEDETEQVRRYTVIYDDGAEGEAFAAERYRVRENKATPACKVDVSDPDAVREGYRFLGWEPEVADTVADDVTYTAQWGKYFSVTYANVPDGIANPNPTRCNEGDTPIALQDLPCDGFLTWVDADGTAVSEIPAGTCGDITLTASIVPRPAYPKDGTNIASGLYHIQCTTCEDHQMTHQAFLYVNTTRPTNNDLHWNAAAKRWEITADVQFSRFINSTVTRKNNFGNMYHHWDLGTGADKNPKIQLYWAPNAEGTTSTGKPVTGLWYGVNGHPTEYEVFCYDKPAAPTEAKIKAMSVKLFWLRDWTNVTHFKKVTKLIDGTYTVGEMTGDKDSGFCVPLTITNMEPYYAVFRTAYGDNFAFDPINSETVPAICLKYSGSATDFKQDGSGWTVDYSNYPSKTAQGNGLALYFYPQWTTVYEDGVDGAAFATQTFVTPASMEGIPQDCLRYNANCFTTPAFTGEPVREGYLFTGWTPEVTTALTASVTYTATWEKACTVTYTDGADGAVFANETHTVSEGADTPAFSGSTERAGYRFAGWSPALAEKVAGDVTYTAQWTKVWTVTYTDGVEGETVFADQSYAVEDGAATPAYAGTINRPGYLFKGWTPGLDKTVTKDVVYTATWAVDTVGLNVPAEPAAANGSSSDSNTPADQGNAPADEGNAPVDEGNVPADEGNAPANEGNAPADEGGVPADEGNVPADSTEPLASSSDLT